MRISTNQIYDHGVSNMLSQQEKALQLQNQLSTGVRVQTPSDDPVASAQIESMNQRLNALQSFQKNNQTITNALNFQDNVMAGISTAIQSLQTAQVQAGNAALSKDDRNALAKTVQGLLGQLQEYANSTDAQGSYMFSGSKSNLPAVSRTYDSSTNSYVYSYNGDNIQRFQAISSSLQVAVNDTADRLFMNIPAGNGSFSISQPSTPNTGTAVASTGSIVNPSSYVPGNFKMNFGLNSSGAMEVTVTDTNTNSTVYNAPYQDGDTINFNGMGISVSGQPAAGDSFSINSNTNESLFATVQKMIKNLTAPYDSAADKAAVQTENSQLMMQLSTALDNISNYRADLGSRLNQLDSVSSVNDSLQLVSQDTIKQLREADPIAVAVQYNLQLVNLQAAQQSFVKIQGLSVFNYL